MASVYILYSKKLNRYYIGSCKSMAERLEWHKNKKYSSGFTAKVDDWDVFMHWDNLEEKMARNIEVHIKRMKSTKYYQNLKIHPEIFDKLKEKYGT